MEADISKVGALGEHLIIIYIRSVSPGPQNGQERKQRERFSFKKNDPLMNQHTCKHPQTVHIFIGRHAHTQTHTLTQTGLLWGSSPDCVECGSTPSVYFEGL